MISQVLPEDVDAVWEAMREPIERALASGQGDEVNESMMMEDVRRGITQMWAVHDEEIHAVVIVSVRDSATRKVWVELLAGSDMDSWADELEDHLVVLKEVMGASCIEASVRKGLSKYLKSRGWNDKAVIVELK